MKENFSQPPMPPKYHNVLNSEILVDDPEYVLVKSFVEGHHPHLGKLHKGWSGDETIVFREYRKGKMKVRK
jgi:hypothetical protein